MATTCTRSTAVSAATRWLRDGVPIEVVSTLLGHSSVSVTSSVYGHLTVEDARAALEKAGWLTGEWRQALGLDEAAEVPSAGGTAVCLHARGVRGGVTVSITATVFDSEEDTW